MSVYSKMQFCMRDGAMPDVALRKHPDLPVLMLTLTYEGGDFTMDGTPEALRGLLMSLLGHPLLAGPVTAPAADSSFYAEVT